MMKFSIVLVSCLIFSACGPDVPYGTLKAPVQEPVLEVDPPEIFEPGPKAEPVPVPQPTVEPTKDPDDTQISGKQRWSMAIAANQGNKEAALMYLVTQNWVSAIPFAMKAGADINYSELGLWRPISRAVSLGLEEMVVELLKHRPELDFFGLFSWSPLFWAVTNDSPNMIRLLVKSGASVNLVYLNKTALITSTIKHGNPETIKLLVSLGADVNGPLKNQEGKPTGPSTALHYAVSNDRYDALKVLLENGGNPYLRDEKGQTVHDLAKVSEKTNSSKIRDLLSKY